MLNYYQSYWRPDRWYSIIFIIVMQVVIENLHFFISSEICQISDEIKSPAGQKALRKTVVLFRRISTEDKNRRQRAGQRTPVWAGGIPVQEAAGSLWKREEHRRTRLLSVWRRTESAGKFIYKELNGKSAGIEAEMEYAGTDRRNSSMRAGRRDGEELRQYFSVISEWFARKR